MSIERKNTDGVKFYVPEEVIQRKLNEMRDELLEQRDNPEQYKKTERTIVEQEARSSWKKIKEASWKAVEPIWEKKEEIIVSVAAKLIRSWLEKQLNKKK